MNARRLWEMLREHWLPHSDSELSQVLCCLQLDQPDPNSLTQVINTVLSWDISSVDITPAVAAVVARKQAEIIHCCSRACMMLASPQTANTDDWIGRADGRLLPAPCSRFVWQIWPWELHFSCQKAFKSPMFRLAGSSHMWQLFMRTDRAEHVSLYLQLVDSSWRSPTELSFRLSAGEACSHSLGELGTITDLPCISCYQNLKGVSPSKAGDGQHELWSRQAQRA